jgi:hypothetical protein
VSVLHWLRQPHLEGTRLSIKHNNILCYNIYFVLSLYSFGLSYPSIWFYYQLYYPIMLYLFLYILLLILDFVVLIPYILIWLTFNWIILIYTILICMALIYMAYCSGEPVQRTGIGLVNLKCGVCVSLLYWYGFRAQKFICKVFFFWQATL